MYCTFLNYTFNLEMYNWITVKAFVLSINNFSVVTGVITNAL